MEQTTMDDILKEPEKPEAVEEKQETPPVEKPVNLRKAHAAKELTAQGRDPETGQFVPKKEEVKEEVKEVKEEKKETKPPEQEMTAKERAAFAAAADERRKRQDLERRLAELEKKPATVETPKEFWDDPEGKFKTFEQKQQETVLEARRIALETRIQTSELLARRAYKDYDEKVEAFKEIVSSTPGLAQQWLAAPDPAEFAYQTAKNHMAIKELGSIDALREKIRQEEREKLQLELKEKVARETAERARLPQSLSDVKGATVNRPAVWGGPSSLENILSGK